MLVFVYFIALYFLLPINKAFDDAPNRILAIYQGIIVVFAAFLTYWVVIKRRRSPLDFVVQAKDKVVNNSTVRIDTKSWKDSTEAEKEMQIAKHLLEYLNVPTTNVPATNVSTTNVSATNEPTTIEHTTNVLATIEPAEYD